MNVEGVTVSWEMLMSAILFLVWLVRLESLAKSTRGRVTTLENNDKRQDIAIANNESGDKLRDERISTLISYKLSSEGSRDAALQKLIHIETLLEGFIKDSNRRLTALEEKMK
jgi:hypothetical protein